MVSKNEIPLNKTKIVGLFVVSAVFIILSILFNRNPKTFVSPIMRSPEVIRTIGITGLCFFGICISFISRKLLDNSPGLIIDQNGITNNTNATNLGLIEWEDITGIETKQVMLTKFLIIHINKPEKYISRTKSVIAKQAMRVNYKTYGSPISITSNSLKIDFSNLESLVRSEFEKRKASR